MRHQLYYVYVGSGLSDRHHGGNGSLHVRPMGKVCSHRRGDGKCDNADTLLDMMMQWHRKEKQVIAFPERMPCYFLVLQCRLSVVEYELYDFCQISYELMMSASREAHCLMGSFGVAKLSELTGAQRTSFYYACIFMTANVHQFIGNFTNNGQIV